MNESMHFLLKNGDFPASHVSELNPLVTGPGKSLFLIAVWYRAGVPRFYSHTTGWIGAGMEPVQAR